MLVLWRRRDRDGSEWWFSLRCWAVLAVGAICWGLIFFGGPGV